jgi:hypothetical protein
MKSKYFKHLFGLIAVLGLLLTSCTNSTEPVGNDLEPVKKIEYTPTVEEAQSQAEELILQTIKPLIEGSAVSNNSVSLGKSSSNATYFYIDGWHTWRGELDESPFGIEDSYNAEFLGKIQFQDGTLTVQQFPENAQYMFVYLNAHAAFGFVGQDPSGDEVWYDFDATVKGVDGNPSVVTGMGEYERRWVGLYSEDGENWVLTEIHNLYEFFMNQLEFQYDWVNNDYTLDGKVTIKNNGIRIIANFSNSRVAMLDIYQNGVLVNQRPFELPNFYETMNVPSLNDLIFGASFVFPGIIPF